MVLTNLLESLQSTKSSFYIHHWCCCRKKEFFLSTIFEVSSEIYDFTSVESISMRQAEGKTDVMEKQQEEWLTWGKWSNYTSYTVDIIKWGSLKYPLINLHLKAWI